MSYILHCNTLLITTRSGTDYENSTGSVMFQFADTAVNFTVAIGNDTEPEIDETFFVLITNVYLIIETPISMCVFNV